jgi:hypothetical protein
MLPPIYIEEKRFWESQSSSIILKGPSLKNTIFFTSINAFYLPKATLLAKSVKKHHPNSTFVLCLVEKEKIEISNPDFDEIVYPESFIGESHNQLIGQYNVVEACTAVKPFFSKWLLEKNPDAKVIYMDPDTYAYSPLDEVLNELDSSSIVVTPHLTVPETKIDAIWDNEISVLRHGTFNLGFFAVKKDENSMKFLEWWSERLKVFSYVDYKNGIFTDQKWVDIAPCFFDVKILKHPGYNLAPWNTHHRKISVDKGSYFVENKYPLRFVHFSGLDSGANIAMIGKYNTNQSYLPELQKEYVNSHGPSKAIPWTYEPNFSSKFFKKKFYEIQRKFQFQNPYQIIGLKKIIYFSLRKAFNLSA